MEIVPYQDSHREQMISVWEKSVRATHHFVTSEEVDRLKELVKQIDFSSYFVYCLISKNEVIGFLGVEDYVLETLFLDPDFIGQKLGAKLMNFALNELKANKVNVNEQNLDAIKFYSKFGFVTYERTEKDEHGNDYPILKMKRQANKSMVQPELTVRKLEANDPIPYGLLLEADPSKELVDSYLTKGQIYLAVYNNAPIGVYLLYPVSLDKIEIKNISVADDFQGKGVGKAMLEDAIRKGREQGYKEILIGTSTTNVGPLHLYQKVGFEFSHILKNFFLDHYTEPLFDYGIQCRHMIVLTKKL